MHATTEPSQRKQNNSHMRVCARAHTHTQTRTAQPNKVERISCQKGALLQHKGAGAAFQRALYPNLGPRTQDGSYGAQVLNETLPNLWFARNSIWLPEHV